LYVLIACIAILINALARSISTTMKKHILTLIASFALATTAFAQVTVTEPWVRATVAHQTASGAFMQLRSPSAARLVAVSSPVAASGELHQMEMSGQMMKMREVDSIELPAGQVVNLAAGGYHIMLVGLKRQLKEGETIPLSLVVETKKGKRQTIAVNASVKPITFSGTQGAVPMHH
jgi:copper(I)-binding protein